MTEKAATSAVGAGAKVVSTRAPLPTVTTKSVEIKTSRSEGGQSETPKPAVAVAAAAAAAPKVQEKIAATPITKASGGDGGGDATARPAGSAARETGAVSKPVTDSSREGRPGRRDSAGTAAPVGTAATPKVPRQLPQQEPPQQQKTPTPTPPPRPTSRGSAERNSSATPPLSVGGRTNGGGGLTADDSRRLAEVGPDEPEPEPLPRRGRIFGAAPVFNEADFLSRNERNARRLAKLAGGAR